MSKDIHVILSDDQYAYWGKLAKLEDKSMSEFIRYAVSVYVAMKNRVKR